MKLDDGQEIFEVSKRDWRIAKRDYNRYVLECMKADASGGEKAIDNVAEEFRGAGIKK